LGVGGWGLESDEQITVRSRIPDQRTDKLVVTTDL
jgi:hypothetical protein